MVAGQQCYAKGGLSCHQNRDDSACDLPEDIVAQYGITVVPLYINLANRGYLDGIEITRKSSIGNCRTITLRLRQRPWPEVFARCTRIGCARRNRNLVHPHVHQLERDRGHG